VTVLKRRGLPLLFSPILYSPAPLLAYSTLLLRSKRPSQPWHLAISAGGSRSHPAGAMPTSAARAEIAKIAKNCCGSFRWPVGLHPNSLTLAVCARKTASRRTNCAASSSARLADTSNSNAVLRKNGELQLLRDTSWTVSLRRAVSLTEAGARFLDGVEPALADIH
jgi:hypothetical protein